MAGLVFILEQSDNRGRLANGHNPGAYMAEFRASRTGKRVMFLASGQPFHVVNSTREDLKYALRRLQPDLVIAAGRKAQAANPGEFPTFEMPHPAWRCWTNRALAATREAIECRLNDCRNKGRGYAEDHNYL